MRRKSEEQWSWNELPFYFIMKQAYRFESSGLVFRKRDVNGSIPLGSGKRWIDARSFGGVIAVSNPQSHV